MAADIPELASRCQSCHQLEQPAATPGLGPQTGKARALIFVGNKVLRDWQLEWWHAPTRIRPAGGCYSNHIATVNDEDLVDDASLTPHPSVDSAQAEVITDWLMTLTPNNELIAAEAGYTPGKVSPRLGAMDFVKFKGCGGCHRDTPEYGGLSGPELYTAWQRLQPGYIVSYMRNPAAWDRQRTMPNRAMGDTQIHKLTDYLKTLSGED